VGKIKFIVSGDGLINIVLDGQVIDIAPDHPNYKTIEKALAADNKKLIKEAADASKLSQPNNLDFYDKKVAHCMAPIDKNEPLPCDICTSKLLCWSLEDEEDK